jgi:hypothetical protein
VRKRKFDASILDGTSDRIEGVERGRARREISLNLIGQSSQHWPTSHVQRVQIQCSGLAAAFLFYNWNIRDAMYTLSISMIKMIYG